MFNQKLKVSLLILTLSSMATAEELTEEAMLKAMEGIQQITILESTPNKIISEVKIEGDLPEIDSEKSITPLIQTVKHKKKVYKKKIYKKKRSHKKHLKKRVQHKKESSDIMNLPVATTLGVVNTTEYLGTEK